jgi:hypothetical protein
LASDENKRKKKLNPAEKKRPVNTIGIETFAQIIENARNRKIQLVEIKHRERGERMRKFLVMMSSLDRKVFRDLLSEEYLHQAQQSCRTNRAT